MARFKFRTSAANCALKFLTRGIKEIMESLGIPDTGNSFPENVSHNMVFRMGDLIAKSDIPVRLDKHAEPSPRAD
jgi:hypothetical protein